jgi:hypothetical protein
MATVPTGARIGEGLARHSAQPKSNIFGAIKIHPYPGGEKNDNEAQDDPQRGQGHRHYRFKVLRDRSPGKDRRQAEYRRRQHVADAEHKKGDNRRRLRFDPKHRASRLSHVDQRQLRRNPQAAAVTFCTTSAGRPRALDAAHLCCQKARQAMLVIAIMPVTRSKFALLIAVAWATTSAAAGQAAVSGDFAGLIDIGRGRKMYLECRGSGSPTVVLVAGLKASAGDWNIAKPSEPTVFAAVAKFTRVCAYDRPGTPVGEKPSRSDPVAQPTTAEDAVSDLHALLSAAGVAGPYVLVGHSYGGLVVRLFASTYPDDVSGLVLVDA